MARQVSDRQREVVAMSAVDAYSMSEITWQEAQRTIVKLLAGKSALRFVLRQLEDARQLKPRKV